MAEPEVAAEAGEKEETDLLTAVVLRDK
jgi:hypothetical protein